MSRWLDAVAAGQPIDLGAVSAAVEHFDALYDRTRLELVVQGRRLSVVAALIPSLTDAIYVAWSELKAIGEVVDLRRLQATGIARKAFIEHYNRELSVAQVENYAKVHPDVVVLAEAQVRVQFVLDKWEGLSKGLERLSHQVKLIGEMRRAGMDDATIE